MLGFAGLNRGELSDGVVNEFGFMIWNCDPVDPVELWWAWERFEDIEDSTDGNGCKSSPVSGCGGVSALFSGEAWND